MTDSGAPGRGARPVTWRAHALGVAWVLAVAGALVAPALAHGTSLGPIDWLSQYGLGRRAGVVAHNRQTLDQVTEMIPWTTVGWTQVHAGYLPLWNPSSGLGMPLAFNWQAASFSVPALVGYMVPLHLAYTAEVLTVLALAGTGAYVLGAVLGLGALGCAMTATVFELGGPFAAWLGWPVAWVMAWAGWLFAALVVVVRGRRRGRSVVVLALAVAAAVYAGQPDMLVMLALVAVVFVVALALWAPGGGRRGRDVARPLVDVAGAALAGAALAAPLLLPGAQLLDGSVRAKKAVTEAPATANLVHLVLQGFDGLPVAGSRWFGTFPYVRSAAYVGVVALVLGAVGVAAAWRRRARLPEAGPFVVVAVVCGAVLFVPPVLSLVTAMPGVRAVNWARALLPLGFALAVLAGVGADAVARAWDERWVRRTTAGGFALAALGLAATWLFGRGGLPAAEGSIRAHSFLWPGLATAGGLGAVALAARGAGRRRGGEGARRSLGAWTAAAALVAEAALLWGASAHLLSSSATALAPTPAERALARTVGGGLVGLGENACFTGRQLGVPPDVNAAFGLSELAVYDPLLPRALLSSWQTATGVTGAPPASEAVPFSLFCPAVDSVSVARRYGVAYVLEPRGVGGPAGTTFVGDVGDEGLYRVPGAARATLVDAPAAGALPAEDAPGSPVRVSSPEPTTWRLRTDAPGPAVLRLRVTAVPGWSATVDGRPLPLERYAGVMLQARLGPGPHAVVLQYRPVAFVAGIWVAGATAVVLGAALALDWRLHRRAGARPARR